MISLRSLSLPALAMTGAATWAWSQELPSPVPTDNLEIRATTVAGPNEIPAITAPIGSPPYPAGGGTGVLFGGPTAAVPGRPGFRVITRPRTVMETYYVTLQPEEITEQKEMQGHIEVLHSDKPAAEKEKAKASLSALLQKQFTRDVERREKEVAELEERVRKLRNQLDKRKEAKDKIISLRLTTIENEAEGLGFPEEGRSGAALNLIGNPTGVGQPYGETFSQPPTATLRTR